MMKWITPAVLSLGVLGAFGAPAQAQRDYYRDYNRDYGYSDRYDNGRDTYRNNYRGDQARRADQLTNRVNRLYDEGRLSREHRDRALDKLQRIRRDVRSRDRFGEDRYQANTDWLDNISRDVDNWSRADSSRGDRHYRHRDRSSWPF